VFLDVVMVVVFTVVVPSTVVFVVVMVSPTVISAVVFSITRVTASASPMPAVPLL